MNTLPITPAPIAVSHTPGPWRVETHKTNPFHFFKVESRRRVICDAFGHNNEDEANARLIAASPDLLNMLQRLLSEVENNCVAPLTIEQARAAILRATKG